jgi:hypothetical protein
MVSKVEILLKESRLSIRRVEFEDSTYSISGNYLIIKTYKIDENNQFSSEINNVFNLSDVDSFKTTTIKK